MSVAPETTGKTSPKERCGRMKPLDFILTTLKAVVALTCFGLFLSNTIFIYSSKVDHDIVETNTEIEKLREDLQNLEHVQSIHDRSLKLVMTEQNTIMYNASCQQIWDEGERNNGLFMIQPSLDGVSFEVECEFTDTAATTVIHHRQSQQGITATPNQKDGCQDRGCFVDKITYSIDKAQVEALIYVSEQCEQEIQHTCYSNALTTYAFWHDRHGREIAYWNGDKTINETGCACYETNECENMEDFNIDRECNCDDMRANLTDFGVLTSMEQLPVTQLNYGGSSEIYAWIEYYLGPFKCTGRRNLYPSEVKSNSFEFKLATASNGEAVMQKNNPLVFDHVVYDHTLGYIENGTFYAPVDGFYRFEIQLSISGLLGFYYDIDVLISGQSVTKLIENGGASVTPDDAVEPYPAHVRHVVDVSMNTGDDLLLMVDERLYPYTNSGQCQTGSIQHECCFMTGRLVRRFADEFGV